MNTGVASGRNALARGDVDDGEAHDDDVPEDEAPEYAMEREVRDW